MFELMDAYSQQAKIKVIGIGDAGTTAVNHMVRANIAGVEFISANIALESLKKSQAKTKLLLDENITKGIGTGTDLNIGRQAVIDDREHIAEVLAGADIVFIAAGMGGGTGTGAAPVVAQVAKDMGIFIIAIVTKPFPFEGERRMQIAEKGILELGKYADSVIAIPNEKLHALLDKNASMLDAFSAANEIIKDAVKAIAELITRPGLINVDFADVRTVMSGMGMATIGSAIAKGDERASDAVFAAVSNPLLGKVNISSASGLLVNISAGIDMSISEFEEVGNAVKEFAANDATIVIGTVIEPEMHEEVRVTIVATGLGSEVEHTGVNKHFSKPVYLLVPDLWGGSEIVDIVKHLSALYRSVGGDELVIKEIQHVSPATPEKTEAKRMFRRTG